MHDLDQHKDSVFYLLTIANLGKVNHKPNKRKIQVEVTRTICLINLKNFNSLHKNLVITYTKNDFSAISNIFSLDAMGVKQM